MTMKLLARLSLAAALALCPLGVSAQTHEESHAAAPHGQAAPETHATAETPQAEAHEGGAAHEAAHEEGASHHHPAMVLFGKTYGNGPAFLVQLLNFAIYIAGLFFILKGAMSAMFKSRKEELETLLSQAERDKAEAEAQMKDLEAKMAGLEGELAGILAKADADAETEKQRVLEAAKAEAEQILAQAEAEIGNQKRVAEQELRALVAELAVEGAAKRLEARLEGAEASKALDRAIQQIGGVQ